MSWNRLGLVFEPGDQQGWMHSHAALPAAIPLKQDVYRVFFTNRDSENRSRIGFFDLDIAGEPRVLDVSPQPILVPGELGTFDDSGVTSGCVVQRGGKLYLYYTGWSLGVSVPFYYFSGLAVSEDQGNSFQKISAAPIMDRSSEDPLLNASPWVILEGGLWRMWYVSGVRWEENDDELKHYYHIKYAESKNGIDWKRTGKVAIDFVDPGEYAFGRPCVLRDGGRYRMWYSSRGSNYKLGYAESDDGYNWERKDQLLDIESRVPDWDSQMQEYPCVFRHNGQLYMLYNGNEFGKTGIGIAIQ